MKIGIIVAMQSELDCVRRLLENPREERYGASLFTIGTNGAHELILTQSGIGKVSSAIRAYELIDRYHPDCVLNTGVAGGIDASMRVMDIVVGDEIVYLGQAEDSGEFITVTSGGCFKRVIAGDIEPMARYL